MSVTTSPLQLATDYKKSDPDLTSNYRPISIRPVFGEIFEAVVTVRPFIFFDSIYLCFCRLRMALGDITRRWPLSLQWQQPRGILWRVSRTKNARLPLIMCDFRFEQSLRCFSPTGIYWDFFWVNQVTVLHVFIYFQPVLNFVRYILPDCPGLWPQKLFNTSKKVICLRLSPKDWAYLQFRYVIPGQSDSLASLASLQLCTFSL